MDINLPNAMKTELNNLQDNQNDCPYELIQRCRRGDHRAQLQVYKLCYKPVFSVCMQRVKDQAVAEAVMHESFLLAFEHINSYAGDISFSAWTKKFIDNALQYRYIC